jgi:transposase
VPELRGGQAIIMDNATFHKSDRVREIIERANCKILYLPPYSPDLNPIEHYWAYLKKQVKKLALDNDNFYDNLVKALKLNYRTMLL